MTPADRGSPVSGGHAFATSLDDWHYALTPAYTTTLDVEGGGTVQLSRRERPQLLLHDGEPQVLYTAVMPSGGIPFTWAQQLGGKQTKTDDEAGASASKSLCDMYHTTPDGLDHGPIYHIMGAINSLAHQWPDQSCCVNDVNGIFTYKGVHHVMHQHGFLSIAHVVSTDLVRWYRVKDAVGGNPWKNGNAWDGGVSLLPEPIGPIILYDSPPEPSNISLARAADPDDPFLVEWTKAGPLVHNDPWHLDMGGQRVDFPSNVWRNEALDHWNMLINVRMPNVSSHDPHAMNTARFQTKNASLEQWELADWNFNPRMSVGDGSDSFFPLPRAEPRSEPQRDINTEPELPQWMLNVHLGEQFAIGSYDPAREKFTPDNRTYTVEYGSNPKHTASATWFSTSAPSAFSNRTLSIGWLSGLGGGNQSQLSCVRELTWNAAEKALLSNPVAEYASLRNSTLASVKNLSLSGSHNLVSAGAGSSDLDADFTVPETAAAEFGLHAFVDGSGRAVITVQITVDAATSGTGSRAGWVNASVDDGRVYGGPFLLPSGERQVKLRSLLDRTSVESFVAGGRAVVTAVSREPIQRQAFGVGLFGSAGVQVSATLDSMGCGWLNSMPTPPAVKALKTDDTQPRRALPLLGLLAAAAPRATAQLTLDKRGYFRNGSQPFVPVGLNYWPATTGCHMWERFPAAEVQHDLDVLKQAGFNSLRIFLVWGQFEQQAGVYNATSFGNLAKVLGWAADRGLHVDISAFVGWMSGHLFWPPWKTKNMYTDPETRARSIAFAGKVAETAAPFAPTLMALEYGNEMNCCTDKAPVPVIISWTHAIYTAFKKHCPGTLVVPGTDEGTIVGDSNGWPIGGPTGRIAGDLLNLHPYPVLFTVRSQNLWRPSGL